MKYLGIDWGMRGLGFAISEGELATPYSAVTIRTFNQAIKEVEQIVKRESVDLLVVGKPEGEMGKAVEKAVQELKRHGLNVVTSDETLSSQQAVRDMVKLGFGKKSRQNDHSTSAAIILQRFLNEKAL